MSAWDKRFPYREDYYWTRRAGTSDEPELVQLILWDGDNWQVLRIGFDVPEGLATYEGHEWQRVKRWEE